MTEQASVTHQMSAALRHTGHGYVADELDRLLTVIRDVTVESSANNGCIDKTTHFKLLAIVAEQTATETPAAA